jgi:hypothetical protein
MPKKTLKQVGFFMTILIVFANKNGITLQNLQFCINIFILTKSDATMKLSFHGMSIKKKQISKNMV